MKKLISISILIFLLFAAGSCKNQSTKPSYRQIMENIPVFHLENYLFFDPDSPLVNRIIDAPDFVLAYLKKIDGVTNYQVYIPTEGEMALCQEYLEKLPGVHKKVLKERLVGIYFIKNFIGSGMADFVLDEEERIYCNLFINPETMKHDISQWLTYRENSCYMDGNPEMSVIQECGTEYMGLMYILLHETTHIVDYVYSVTPYIYEAIKEIFHKKSTPTLFTRGIWKAFDTPVKEYDFPNRTRITFYGLRGGPKIDKSEAEALYTCCEQTPFTSLYATWNWAEDWAEFVTWYYFTGVLHQPYEIRVYKDDSLIYTFTPMESEKVKERIPVVVEILNTLSDSKI